MCALLVGLPDVTVIGVVHRHGIREVEFVDLPVFGRPTRLVWRKQRWRCTTCGRCWCDDDPEIATTRCALTTASTLGRRAACFPRQRGTTRPVWVVVAPIKSTMVRMSVRGWPHHFPEMNENSRCSILFHFDVPGG